MTEADSLSAPFRLELLGRIDLRDAEGKEVRSVLAQPKRLALLAYLARSPRPGFVRRDLLVALFWPELDQERARGALRKAVHYLRRSLSDGTIEGRGDEELGIPAGLLRSDVEEFEGALDRGDRAEALGLYRGELLPGVFVSDAPDFQRWLDGERDRLRNRAEGAAWELAEGGAATGSREEARRWGEYAYGLSPLSEVSVRRLMSLFLTSGDRAAALRAFETFERRVVAEMGVEPGAETRTLAARAREEGGEAVAPPPPAPPANGGNGDLGDPGAPRTAVPVAASSPPVPRRSPGSPGKILLAALGVAALALALVQGMRSVPAGTTLPATKLDSDRVAVLPFQVRGPADLDYLREGLAVLLANGIDGAGSLRSVDPDRFLGGAEQGDEALREAAMRAGAGLLLRGSVVAAGDELQIEASIVPATGNGASLARAEVVGREDDLIQLVGELTTRLLASLLRERGDHLAGSAALSATSLTALKSYLRGEAEFRAGSFDRAVEWFQAAVEEDPEFALAHYQLSSSANWAGRMELVSPALQAATRNRERLSGRALLLVEAAGIRAENSSEALRRYRAILERYPDDADAALELAEILFHQAPLLGRPMTESREAFEGVVSRRPADLNSMVHLVRLAALTGDREGVDRLTGLVLGLAPGGDQVAEMQLLRAFALGEAAAADVALAERERLGDQRIWDALWRSAAYSGSLAEAREFGARMVRAADPPEWVAAARLFLAHAEMARGRRNAAFHELNEVERSAPGIAAQSRALFATLPSLPVDTTGLREALAVLEGIGVGTGRAEPGIYRGNPLWLDTNPNLLHFHMGLLALALGERDAAAEHARQLREAASGSSDLSLTMASAELEARIALREGRPEAALPALEAVVETLRERSTSANPVIPRASFRFTHAELLRALGRQEEALAWYGTIPEDLGFDLIYLAPAHFRRGELLGAMGRREEAAVALARAAELWVDADPEFRRRGRP